MMYGSRLVRQRPRMVASHLNPERLVPAWDDPDELDVVGFLDAAATSEDPDVSREEAVSSATLYVDDPAVDIRRGDRITDGVRSWRVQGFPAAPMNPFDGWQPYVVVNLREVKG